MLLRSSSTPLLGSLLQSYSENPNNHHSELHTPNSILVHGKLSRSNYHDFRKSSFFQSPEIRSTTTTTTTTPGTGFRRVQSDGNLEDLAGDLHNVDEFNFFKKPAATKTAIPSFSPHHLETSFEDDCTDCDDEETENGSEDGDDDNLEVEDTCDSLRVRNSVHGYGSSGFESEGKKMYLATGLGVSSTIDCVGAGGHGGGGSYNRPVAFERDGGDNRGSLSSMEEHYKKMLEGNPGNSLFLRNYAQFLYQIKGDVGRAEEYYSRAILADPDDGEILSQYAKLTWELHHDKHRAANYFKRAIRASSQDSHIHAAYASFLWDTEDEDEDKEYAADNSTIDQPILQRGFMASASA